MIKLDLRHSKVGDTAFKCLSIDAEDIVGMTVHSVFKRVLKALIRETYLNGVVTSVNEAAKLADEEIAEIDIDADFILWFIDKYINVEKFRDWVTIYIKASYDNGSTVLGEFMDLFKKDSTDRWGKIEHGTDDGFSDRESYILALLNSMFRYLFTCKENYYRRLSSNRVIKGVKNDLFIIESKGYYWQTCGERVDGIGSKLKIPNLIDIVPKILYDIEDNGYGIVNSSDVISAYSTGVLIKIATLKDLSKLAYSEYLDIALSEDTYDALEEDFTLFEIFSDYVDACLRYRITDEELPVLKSFVEQW